MRNRYVLLFDLPLIAIAAFGAFAARFDWQFYLHEPGFLPYACAALLIKPVVFYLLGMYRRYWRYTSIQDLGAIFTAISASSAAMAVFVAAEQRAFFVAGFSRVVLLTDWLMTLATVGGLRVAIRVVSESYAAGQAVRQSSAPRRILIVGAGAAGTMVAREMRRNPQLGMQPIAFLDDDPVKIGKRITSLPVVGATRLLLDVVRSHEIDSVVIAMPTAPGPVLRTILAMCNDAGVTSQMMPGVFELLDGNVSVSRLRSVDIADLLRRAPASSQPNASEYLRGQRVLVTGGGGSIGLELCRQVAAAGPSRLVMLGHGENSVFDACQSLREVFPGIHLQAVIADVRDRERLSRLLGDLRPDVVFHAAAHKHVPLMEENPEEAITNNVVGTQNVVDAAAAAGTQRLVLISTDKAVCPTSIMGASKRMAEMIVRDAARRHKRAFVAVRFGNVLGSRGSVVPLFKAQIERGGPITITHPDMKRFFMTIPEAVHLVLQAGGMARGGELLALNMGEPMKIVDLATDLVRLSGLSPDDVPIVFTGVRPGEKLVEALWEQGASVEATANPDVLNIVEKDGLGPEQLVTQTTALCAAAAVGDTAAIRSVLARCIPTFAAPVSSAATALRG